MLVACFGSEASCSMYQPGDVVSRRKGVFMHRGIVLEDGTVLHNTPFRGKHRSSLEEFSKHKTIYPSNHRYEVRSRTLSNVRYDRHATYNPFTNNCEHLVTRATRNKSSSPQLRGWVVGALVAGVGFAITRSPSIAIAGFALGKKFASSEELA